MSVFSLRISLASVVLAGVSNACLAIPNGPVTVNELLQEALSSSYQVKIEELSPLIARDQVMSAKGEFSPFIFAEYKYIDTYRPQNSFDWSTIGPGAEHQHGPDEPHPEFTDPRAFYFEHAHEISTGIGGKTPFGTEYELSWKIDRSKNTINQRQQDLSSLFYPEWESFAGITVTQPLLRNFGTNANLAELRIARIQLGIAEYDREIGLINQSIEVLNAIYDLVYAQENLRVKQEAVDVAGLLLENNKRRREVGFLSQIDVKEAEVRVSEAMEELILARDFLRERKIALLQVMGKSVEPGQPLPDFEIVANLDGAAPQVDLNQLVHSALQSRPDFLQAIEEQKVENTRAKQARRQKLPELNLQFSYGYYGLSGEFDNAVRDMTDNEHTAFTGGFVFTMPLDNKRLDSRWLAARRRERQAELRLADLENRIRLDVRNSVERLDALSQRLETARSSAELAKEALDIEAARLESGQASSLTVSELQERLSNARSREVAALVDLQKAIAEMWATSGQLLQRHGVNIDRVVSNEEVDKSFFSLPGRG